MQHAAPEETVVYAGGCWYFIADVSVPPTGWLRLTAVPRGQAAWWEPQL